MCSHDCGRLWNIFITPETSPVPSGGPPPPHPSPTGSCPCVQSPVHKPDSLCKVPKDVCGVMLSKNESSSYFSGKS